MTSPARSGGSGGLPGTASGRRFGATRIYRPSRQSRDHGQPLIVGLGFDGEGCPSVQTTLGAPEQQRSWAALPGRTGPPHPSPEILRNGKQAASPFIGGLRCHVPHPAGRTSGEPEPGPRWVDRGDLEVDEALGQPEGTDVCDGTAGQRPPGPRVRSDPRRLNTHIAPTRRARTHRVDGRCIGPTRAA